MKKIISITVAFFTMLFLIGCGGASLTPKQEAIVNSQTEVYTQVSMWVDNNKVYGTNYANGLHIPVNTKVKILDMNAKVIKFEYLGASIAYLVMSKHTKVNAGKTLERLFSQNAVNLSKYSSTTRDNITNGKVEVGMTKEEVVLSRGYPPFHQTLSLQANKWKYWYNRFKTVNVTFKNNKVVESADSTTSPVFFQFGRR